jgi:hypothetical protein
VKAWQLLAIVGLAAVAWWAYKDARRAALAAQAHLIQIGRENDIADTGATVIKILPALLA